MSIKITKDRLMDQIGELPAEFVLEAEYTEEELARLNAPDGKKAGSAATMNETSKKTDRVKELTTTKANEEDNDIVPQPEAVPKKAATILWITMGVALAAAAILLIVFFWNPDRSNVVTTTEAETKTELDELKKAEVGDYITFGSYEQDNNLENGAEAIEWLVLNKQKDKMLVISRYGLDSQPYNPVAGGVRWENCSLRNWLNSTFYEAAFLPEEKDMILATTIQAEVNPNYNIPMGNDTTDRVFLLSTDEAKGYFYDDEARMCQGTRYCYAQGALESEDGCSWWLRSMRSPGVDSSLPVFVLSGGYVFLRGTTVFGEGLAVRPAMWINLGSPDTSKETEETPKETLEATPSDLRSAPAGTYIRFGKYEQDNDESNGKEEIEWFILDKQEDKMLVISRYALEYLPYNTEQKKVTWETCSLREWLNSTFYEAAFDSEEQRLILNTTDRVFLLSMEEARSYFASDVYNWMAEDDARACQGTSYCYAKGAVKGDNYGTCWWWLRSPGSYPDSAAGVYNEGSIDDMGYKVTFEQAVRPAMWISLEPEEVKTTE
ncbi:MAG: hypothetical protein IKX10_06520 [Lachnospiraceae bacterium]|nr:hypothetical protein [Lachnospiraceae bacterium]